MTPTQTLEARIAQLEAQLETATLGLKRIQGYANSEKFAVEGIAAGDIDLRVREVLSEVTDVECEAWGAACDLRAEKWGSEVVALKPAANIAWYGFTVHGERLAVSRVA